MFSEPKPKKAAPKRKKKADFSDDSADDSFGIPKKKSTAAKKVIMIVCCGDVWLKMHCPLLITFMYIFQKKGSDDDDFNIDAEEIAPRARTGRAKTQVKYNFGDDDDDSDF